MPLVVRSLVSRPAFSHVSPPRWAAVGLLLVLLLAAAPQTWGQCNSAASLVADVWDEYERRAQQAGCVAPVRSPFRHGPRNRLKFLACHADAPGKTLNVIDGMIGWWNNMAGGEWATIGPRQLGVGTEEGRLVGTSGRLFLGVAPANSAVATLRLWNDSGRGRTRVTVCSHPRSGPPGVLVDQVVDPDAGGRWSWNLTGQQDRILSVRLDGRSAARHFEYRLRLDTQPLRWDYPADGFADLHVHQAAELSGGGRWYWGDHTRPSTSQRSCRVLPDWKMILDPVPGFSFQGLHALPIDVRTRGLADGDTGFYHGTPGVDWPSWADVAHHQVTSDQLRAAHEAGLNLVVVSAVNNQYLCEVVKVFYPGIWDTVGCNDMAAVKRQLRAFIDFAAVHPWYEIAVDPWHARKIIHEGKLAVVLSMEVSNLFRHDEGDFIEQLDELRALGLRSLQVAHETDNRFSGAAPHRGLFELMNWLKHPSLSHLSQGGGFEYDAAGLNAKGLTTEGRRLVAAMVQRGMLVDASHMGVNAVRDLHELLTDGRKCPWYQSHSRPQAMLPPAVAARQRELVTTDEQLAQLALVGGMVGIRSGPDAALSLNAVDGITTGVPNDCAGSSKSAAQLIGYVGRRGVDMAFGSDFNGNITQANPRFGADACFRAGRPPARAAQAALQGGPVGTAFDTAGLAHIGLLPDLLTELENLGTPEIESVANSAESFIRMWERAWSPRCMQGVGKTDRVSRCRSQDDCPGGTFCPVGVGERRCKPKKADGVVCTAAHMCAGGECERVCYTSGSKGMGESCKVNAECGEGKCSAAPGGIANGKCVCDSDSQCVNGWCDKGVVAGIGTNACKALKDQGKGCSRGTQCKSGCCKVFWGVPQCRPSSKC